MNGRNYRLRKAAEEAAAKKPENLNNPSNADVQNLTHELHVHQIELETQNEELRRAQVELEESRSKYADLYDFAPVGYFTLDKNFIIQEVNLTGAALLRVERKYLIKKALLNYTIKGDSRLLCAYQTKLLSTDTRQACELGIRRKDGTEFYAQLEGVAVFDSRGDVVHFRVAMLDITERKSAEEQVRKSLKQKEMLLKEVHHRVKNNLQIMSSILNLQARVIKDEQMRIQLKESRNRIKSMALIHEKLYESENFDAINIGEYVRSLATHLFHSYSAGPRIKLRVRVDGVPANIDEAIPCGLIINELVSNSLKHAFPGGKEGEVRIDLYSGRREDGSAVEREAGGECEIRPYTLIVGNDGVPFPEGVDFRNTESLGLPLVCVLVEQLGGDIELSADGGTAFKMAFPAR